MSRSFTLRIAAVSAAIALAGAAYAQTAAPAAAPATRPGGEAQPRGEGGAGGEGRGNAAGAPAGRGRGAQVPANLEAAMGEMNRMLTALKGEATDFAKSEQALHDLMTLQRDISISKLLNPPSTNRMNAEDKAKAIASFHVMMNGLLRTTMDIEDAIIAKKPDDVKKGLAQLEEFEKAGHAEFNVKPD